MQSPIIYFYKNKRSMERSICSSTAGVMYLRVYILPIVMYVYIHAPAEVKAFCEEETES
jgi:hypothetical protein